MAPPRVHRFYIGIYGEKYEKIFLSETKRPRALIFGMKHHLVDLCQVCSSETPGAKNGNAPGITCFTKAYIGRSIKNLLV